jgi:hypothetical protein
MELISRFYFVFYKQFTLNGVALVPAGHTVCSRKNVYKQSSVG